MPTTTAPIRIALIDDYDVVLAGIAAMLTPYRDCIHVVEIDANKPLRADVDIALYDSFAQTDTDGDDIATLVGSPRARHVVIYTWNFHPDQIARARRQGVHGYLSKALPAGELVQALHAVHTGNIVISDPPGLARAGMTSDWPGRQEGLSDREAEIIALITQGKTNAEIARHTFLSPNTIKSYIRSAYRKIHITRRTEAILWGIEHGFTPDHRRIDPWRAPGAADRQASSYGR